MSVDKRRIDDVSSRQREETESLSHPTGLVGRLKAHFDRWAQLYIDQQVEARTGETRHR